MYIITNSVIKTKDFIKEKIINKTAEALILRKKLKKRKKNY